MISSSSSQNPINVLLVEDDPGSRQLVRRALHDHDASVCYKISEAEDLATARQMLTEKSFDNVILDLHLPDSSGMDTLHSIREINSDVPVVVLSGITDHETAINSIRHGADYYIVKGNMLREMLGRSICYSIERKRRKLDNGEHEQLQSHVDLLKYQIREVKESLSDQIHSKSHAEWSMQKMSEEHETLLDILPAMIWHIDKKGEIIRLNKPAADLINIKFCDAIGKDFYRLFAGNDNQLRMKHENIYNNGTPSCDDEAYKNSLGKLQYHQTEVIPHRDKFGSISGLVIMAKKSKSQQEPNSSATFGKTLKEKFLPDNSFMSRQAGAVRIEKNTKPQKQYCGKILVVDNDSLNRILIGAHLQNSGLDVEFAISGGEAINKTSSENFDLVMTSLLMPEMDGLQVSEKLRQTDFQSPILMMTSDYSAATVKKITEAGCDGHILKPINKKDIFAAFDKFLPSPVEV